MLNLMQIIEQAEKLGFEYFSDESIDHFEFSDERISVPFASYIHAQSGFRVLTSLVRESIAKADENIKEAHENSGEGARILFVEKETLSEPLPADVAEMIKQMLGSMLGSIQAAQDVYLSMYVIVLVSKFESYIQDIVTEISRHYPVTMRSGKTISVNEVLQFSEISSLVEYLAQNASSKSTEGTVTEYMCRLGGKFGIAICQFKDLISEVEFFVDIRHIQVHKNGVIDSQFHRKHPNTGNLGEVIKLNFDLLAQMSRVFRLTVNLIEVMLVKKFPKIAQVTSDEEIDNIFIEMERICAGEKISFAE